MRIALLLLVTMAAAQSTVDDPERLRQIWDDNFLQQRPAAKVQSPARPQAKPPRPIPALSIPAENLGDAFVGITIWNLRPSHPQDSPGSRLLVYDLTRNRDEELTPVRMNGETPVSEGQKIRLSVESARAGYLYVVDREQYSDGTYSDPYLIFPVMAIRGGRNAVGPGRFVEIPAAEERPSYFTFHRNFAAGAKDAGKGLEQVREVLTILVTPRPIEGLHIGNSALKLKAEEVAEWEKKWSTRVKRLDARAQAGKPYTPAEKQAGQQGSTLNGDDPVPQTLYHCDAKTGEPLLVNVPVEIAK